LSYPELIPEPYHLQCLYQNQGGLVARLRWALTHGDEAQQIAAELAQSTARFDWSEIVKGYDDFLESTAL
jgi:hypothetical protein